MLISPRIKNDDYAVDLALLVVLETLPVPKGLRRHDVRLRHLFNMPPCRLNFGPCPLEGSFFIDRLDVDVCKSARCLFFGLRARSGFQLKLNDMDWLFHAA